MNWKLADAKNKFSEVVNLALQDGPQFISRRDENVVVVLSQSQYDKLAGTHPSFKEFLMGSGPNFDKLDLERDTSTMRDLEL